MSPEIWTMFDNINFGQAKASVEYDRDFMQYEDLVAAFYNAWLRI